MTGRCIVVGSINTDLVLEVPRFGRPGETVVAEQWRVVGGGKGANQAIAAARLGAEVYLVGAVGDDPFSQQRYAQIEAAGVRTSWVCRNTGLGGFAVIELGSRGENRIVVVPGTNSLVGEELVKNAFQALAVTSSDVVMVQLEIPFPAVSSALQLAHEVGAVSVLNAAPWKAEARGVLPYCQVLILNAIEARQMAGLGDEIPLTMIAENLRQFAPAVVVTMGATGALAATSLGNWYCAAPAVEVVDTTGAGDAFCGAVAVGLLERRSWPELLRRAVCAGALAVQRFGAQPSLPYREELEQFLGVCPVATEWPK